MSWVTCWRNNRGAQQRFATLMGTWRQCVTILVFYLCVWKHVKFLWVLRRSQRVRGGGAQGWQNHLLDPSADCSDLERHAWPGRVLHMISVYTPDGLLCDSRLCKWRNLLVLVCSMMMIYCMFYPGLITSDLPSILLTCKLNLKHYCRWFISL